MSEEKHLLRQERAGMEDLLQSREQDIEELNDEIKGLKAKIDDIMKTTANHHLIREIKELKEKLNRNEELLNRCVADKQSIERSYKRERDALHEQKKPSKKICPLFYGRTHGSDSCKQEGCMMWIKGNKHVSDYCTITKGFGFLQNIGMGE